MQLFSESSDLPGFLPFFTPDSSWCRLVGGLIRISVCICICHPVVELQLLASGMCV